MDVDQVESVDERQSSRLVECVEAFAAASTVTEVTYFRRLLKLFLALGARGQCKKIAAGARSSPCRTIPPSACAWWHREDRVALIGQERGLNPTEAARYVESTDRERSRFIRQHFRKDLTDPLLYDLVLNASRLSVEECASIVIETLLRLQARNASVKQGLVPSRESGVEQQLDQPSTLP